MSGICGFYNGGRKRLLEEMCGAFARGGADGPAGLGMSRLEIIGGHTGRRPVSNEDAAVTVVFDGEIYNFR